MDIFSAARTGNVEIFNQQLSPEFPRITLSVRDINDNTPLMIASKHGKSEIVSIINTILSQQADFQTGPEINNVNNRGESALMLACGRFSNLATASMLLNSFPNININQANNQGNTALMFACSHPFNNEILDYLLSRPDIDYMHVNNEGNSALMIACKDAGNKVDRLLQQNQIFAGINNTNNVGNTALMIACLAGNRLSVDRLLQVPGINVNHPNNEGTTALMLACETDDENETVHQLLQVPGIDVNHSNNNNETALMIATRNNHINIRITLEAFINQHPPPQQQVGGFYNKYIKYNNKLIGIMLLISATNKFV
jgi:ankyrin repeat protein